MGQHALRKGRWSERGQVYLITTTTHARWRVFHDLAMGRIVVNALRWSDQQGRTRTWAFVVMPDHLHWLAELTGAAPLSAVVQSVKKFSARKILSSTGSRGPVWQQGYHDHALRKEEDLEAVARYVVRNPVRAGIVRSVRHYALWDASWVGRV